MFKQKNKQKNVIIFNIDNVFNSTLFFSFVHSNHHVFCTFSNDETKSKIEDKLSSLPVPQDNFTLFKINDFEDYSSFFSSLKEQSIKIDTLFFNPNIYDFGTLNSIEHSLHLKTLQDNIRFLHLLNELDESLLSPSVSLFFLHNNYLNKSPGFTLNSANFRHMQDVINRSTIKTKFKVIYFNHSFISKTFWNTKYDSLPFEQINHQSSEELNISYFYNASPIKTDIDHRVLNRILDLCESNILFRRRFSFIPVKDHIYFLKIKFKFDYSHSFYKLKKNILSFKTKKKNKVH